MEDSAPIMGILFAAISTLFGALVFSYKSQLDKAYKLFEDEKLEHKETRKTAAEDSRENTAAINKLADSNAEILSIVRDRLRRQEDWGGSERRESRRT